MTDISKWTLTPEHRQELERCRNDFRLGLPGGGQLQAICVTGMLACDVPWHQLIPDGVRRLVLGNRYDFETEKEYALCLQGEELKDRDIDLFVQLAISTMRCLTQSRFPKLFAPDDNRVNPVQDWVLRVIMPMLGQGLTGYIDGENVTGFVDWHDYPGWDADHRPDIDLQQPPESVWAKRGRVSYPSLNDDLMVESMLVVDHMLRLARSNESRMAGDPGGGTADRDGDIKAVKHEAFKTTSSATVRPKSKKSTERGEGQAKLLAALTMHHKYADGACLNQQPIGNNELACLAKVSGSTASAFFKHKFGGHKKYKTLCFDRSGLIAALKLLNQEFTPHHLFGAQPPGEVERKDEE